MTADQYRRERQIIEDLRREAELELTEASRHAYRAHQLEREAEARNEQLAQVRAA